MCVCVCVCGGVGGSKEAVGARIQGKQGEVQGYKASKERRRTTRRQSFEQHPKHKTLHTKPYVPSPTPSTKPQTPNPKVKSFTELHFWVRSSLLKLRVTKELRVG